ncbi:SDR family oxidoreductase [Streptomyces sp. NBC_00637]|uniref:SDR family oxidoreductase n=1 Tax=Streptomyces sp. NBC_00637 TaxID=2903667 RepID=UPI003864E798
MYRGKGIRANAIAPGGTKTAIVVDAEQGAHGPAALGPHFVDVGRPAEPEERAAAIVFLGSDAASNVNGVILPVDGRMVGV